MTYLDMIKQVLASWFWHGCVFGLGRGGMGGRDAGAARREGEPRPLP